MYLFILGVLLGAIIGFFMAAMMAQSSTSITEEDM